MGGRVITECLFCLQVDWPSTSSSYKREWGWGWGAGGGWLRGAYKLKFTVSTVAPTRLTLLIFNTITSVLRTFGPIPLVVLIKETLKLSVYAFYPSA